MPLTIYRGETNVTRRRIFFQCVNAVDGLTPELGEAGGQPQISVSGTAWVSANIGTLVSIGFGRYYAQLGTLAVGVPCVIESRYKSANTAEIVGTIVQVVMYDPNDPDTLGLTNLDAPISGIDAVLSGVHGVGSWEMTAATIQVTGYTTEGEKWHVYLRRGDSFTLSLTATEVESGDPVDLTPYVGGAVKLTAKHERYRGDNDDVNALFQITGSIIGDPTNGQMSFSGGPGDTNTADLSDYDIGIQAQNAGGSTVQTLKVGVLHLQHDVGRT